MRQAITLPEEMLLTKGEKEERKVVRTSFTDAAEFRKHILAQHGVQVKLADLKVGAPNPSAAAVAALAKQPNLCELPALFRDYMAQNVGLYAGDHGGQSFSPQVDYCVSLVNSGTLYCMYCSAYKHLDFDVLQPIHASSNFYGSEWFDYVEAERERVAGRGDNAEPLKFPARLQVLFHCTVGSKQRSFALVRKRS